MKKLAALALLFPLAACGFRPMYADNLDPQLAAIFVEPVAERDGYELRNTLIDLLHSDGDKAGKRYRLHIVMNESSQGIALQNDATITRYNTTLGATFELYDMKGDLLTKGTQSEMAAYNVVQSPYATLTAQMDSSKRAAQDVAERIHLDLGVWFRNRKK